MGEHSIITFIIKRERGPSKCKRIRTGGEGVLSMRTFTHVLLLYLVDKLFEIITDFQLVSSKYLSCFV